MKVVWCTVTYPVLLTGSSNSAGALKNPWQCGLCNFQCSTRSEVLDHTSGAHGLKSQFKCGVCSYRSSSKASFDSHFASRHPAAEKVALIHVYRKVGNHVCCKMNSNIFPKYGFRFWRYPLFLTTVPGKIYSVSVTWIGPWATQLRDNLNMACIMLVPHSIQWKRWFPVMSGKSIPFRFISLDDVYIFLVS